MAKNKGSVVNIIEGAVITVLILLIAVMLVMYFSFSKTGAAPSFFGYTFYRTMAVNMETDIPAGTAIIAKESEKENIKVGSVVLCRIGEDTVLTRVVQLVNENGELSYVVKFDTAPANDTFKIPDENVIAKAVMQSSLLGSLLGFATSTVGIMLVIIIPSFIIIVFQIVRIINVKRTEEEASSLDDLDEIMLDTDGRFEDMFSEDISDDEQQTPFRSAAREEKREENVPEVLSVDKNGKAGLSALKQDDNSPLFVYDDMKPVREKSTKPKQDHSIVKPVRTPNTDNFYSEYVSNSERDPLYGSRIKRQEIIPEEDGAEEKKELFTEQQDKARSAEKSGKGTPAFMSNVLPDAIAQTAKTAETAANEVPAEPVKKYEPKPIPGDAAMGIADSIPKNAAVPKEKLAPPPKKNNSKAISELMSIIDAEESKLHK